MAFQSIVCDRPLSTGETSGRTANSTFSILEEELLIKKRSAFQRIFKTRSGEPVKLYAGHFNVDRYNSSGPNGSINYRVVSSAKEDIRYPIIFYIDGIENSFFSSPQRQLIALKNLCYLTQTMVITIDCHKTRSTDFARRLEECYRGLRWVANNFGFYSGDTDKIIVAGVGMGANIAAALSLVSRERNGPEVKMQLLVDPACGPLANDLRHQASPLLLPPAYVITTQNDPTARAEEHYACTLAQAGYAVKLRRYLGYAGNLIMLSDKKAAMKVYTDIAAQIRCALETHEPFTK